MRNVLATTAPRKPVPSPAEARTTAMLIDTIRRVLDTDGSFVEPGSIDSQGLTVIAGVYRFRVEVSEHSPSPRCTNPTPADFGTQYGRYGTTDERAAWRRRHEAQMADPADDGDRDWMAETGDDIAF